MVWGYQSETPQIQVESTKSSTVNRSIKQDQINKLDCTPKWCNNLLISEKINTLEAGKPVSNNNFRFAQETYIASINQSQVDVTLLKPYTWNPPKKGPIVAISTPPFWCTLLVMVAGTTKTPWNVYFSPGNSWWNYNLSLEPLNIMISVK